MGEEKPAYRLEVSSDLAGVWMLVSLVLFVAAAAGTGLLYALLRQSPFESAGSLLLWPVAFLAVLPAHELIHAAFVRLFGGRPRFGAGVKGGMPYLYVTDPGRRFSRNRFLVITLAPLVLIDAFALALILVRPSWSWAAPALVGNTSGAVGDLWVAGLLVRFPSWAQVEDRTLGLAVWPAHGHSREEVRAHAPQRTVALPAWISAWVLSTLAIFAVLPAAIGAVLGRTGQGPTVREMNFGLVFVVAAAVAGALVLGWARWRRWRGR
jgi:hypothetical protein